MDTGSSESASQNERTKHIQRRWRNKHVNTALDIQSNRREGTRTGTPKSGLIEVVKPRLLDAKDAASYLGVSETRVREYVKYGKLQCVTLPHPFKAAKDTRKILIEVQELDAFIERHK